MVIDTVLNSPTKIIWEQLQWNPSKEQLKQLTKLQCLLKEWNKKVIFLYTVIKGFANESYVIHVADLAGIPKSVLQRAKHILDNFLFQNVLLLCVNIISRFQFSQISLKKRNKILTKTLF